MADNGEFALNEDTLTKQVIVRKRHEENANDCRLWCQPEDKIRQFSEKYQIHLYEKFI